MNKDEIKLYRCALEKWGVEAQIGMLHEEMAELIVAVNKWRRGIFLAGSVLEEIADVEIMLEQLRLIIADSAPATPVEDVLHSEEFTRNLKLDALRNRVAGLERERERPDAVQRGEQAALRSGSSCAGNSSTAGRWAGRTPGCWVRRRN